MIPDRAAPASSPDKRAWARNADPAVLMTAGSAHVLAGMRLLNSALTCENVVDGGILVG